MDKNKPFWSLILIFQYLSAELGLSSLTVHHLIFEKLIVKQQFPKNSLSDQNMKSVAG